MTQSDLKPQILSVKEFRLEFNIPDSALSVGKYENGHYGWQAKLSDGSILRGPVSQKLLSKGEDATAAFVKYFWDEEGEPLNAPVWVLQIRPTQAQIKKTFALCQLLNLLNDKKKILFGEKWRRLYLSEFKAILVDCKKEGAYIDFSIPKKNGKLRHISSPNHELKIVQSCLNLILQEKYHPTAAAMGFVPGRSVADNARVHMGQNYVYNIDIKDFFPSISQGRVFAMLQQSPYSFDKATASIIADLCCYKGVLPQGAPTSPILTNIICERLDWRLSKLAKRYNLKYSRYADDISFSGMVNVFHKDGRFVEELQHYIQKEGFTINPEKTRLNTIGGRQEVTGLTVNEKPNVSKQYVKSLRTMIYNWEKMGREEAQKKMALIYQKAGKRSVKGIPQIENVIQGKLNYLKMIKGGSDTTYLKLNDRFQALMGQLSGLHEILKIWEKEGIEAASCEYYNRIPFEELFDRGVWTLSEFESITGKKVDFVPARKSRPDYSKEARKAMSMFNTQTNESDTGASDANSDDPKNSLLANALQEMGFKENLDAVIDNQPYWGNIQLTCDWKIDLQKDIFVSYGDGAKGRKCLYFSNTRGYLINGNLMTQEDVQKVIDDIRQYGSSDNFLETVLKDKCVSYEDRALRTKLYKGILNELEEDNEKLRRRAPQHNNKTIAEALKNGLIIHDPKKVVERMRLFTIEGPLKYTTHLWDHSTDGEGFAYKGLDDFVQKYTEQARSLFEDIKDKYNEPLWKLIFSFLWNKKDMDRGWGKHHIKVGYCTPGTYLKEWMAENPDKRPTSMPLSMLPPKFRPEKVNGKSLVYFGDVVNVFKKSIAFRDDDLYYLFKSWGHSSNIQINEEKLMTLRGVGFFTNTAKIEDVLQRIYENFNNRAHYPEVEVSANRTDKHSVTIEILQRGSFSDADLNNNEKLNLLNNAGDMVLIRESLRGLCDWSIESRFTNEGEKEFWRIDYLYYAQNEDNIDNQIPVKPRKVKIDIADGFKHILTFYEKSTDC